MNVTEVEVLFLYLKNHESNGHVKIAPLQDMILDILSASEEEKAIAAKPVRKSRAKKVEVAE